MKQKLQAPLLIALMAITIFSCKDDEKKISNTGLLTAKKWTITKYEVNGYDIFSEFFDDCAKDNFFKFSANGTCVADAGIIKCDTDEKNDTGTWQWKEKETILSMQFLNDDFYDFKLVELTPTSLKISRYNNDLGADVITTFVGK